jgi:hypothetical protein
MTRKTTTKLLLALEEGYPSWESVARAALSYMSESQVCDLAECEGFLEEEEEEEEEEEGEDG